MAPGNDRIKELWTCNTEERLLAFLCSVAIDCERGNSLYQYFLFGPRAFPRPTSGECGSNPIYELQRCASAVFFFEYLLNPVHVV